jgi:hypothetical protein
MVVPGSRTEKANSIIAARRLRVGQLAKEGHSNRVIAKTVGNDEATVRRDLKFLSTPPDQRPVSKRRQRRRLTDAELLKQMLTVAKRWIAAEALNRHDVFEVLNAAGKRLEFGGISGRFDFGSLRPAELLPLMRPAHYDDGDMPAKLESCTVWLAAWLASCAPWDVKLRDDVLNKLERWTEVTLS